MCVKKIEAGFSYFYAFATAPFQICMFLVSHIRHSSGISFRADTHTLARGHRSPEFFGSFTRALFTLFQICTGDGWVGILAIKGIISPEEPTINLWLNFNFHVHVKKVAVTYHILN
jgi:hypothetical protein